MLVVVVLVNVAIVETLFVTGGPAKTTLIGIATFFALHLALVMIPRPSFAARTLPTRSTACGRASARPFPNDLAPVAQWSFGPERPAAIRPVPSVLGAARVR
jgi:hypothetical protein